MDENKSGLPSGQGNGQSTVSGENRNTVAHEPDTQTPDAPEPRQENLMAPAVSAQKSKPILPAIIITVLLLMIACLVGFILYMRNQMHTLVLEAQTASSSAERKPERRDETDAAIYADIPEAAVTEDILMQEMTADTSEQQPNEQEADAPGTTTVSDISAVQTTAPPAVSVTVYIVSTTDFTNPHATTTTKMQTKATSRITTTTKTTTKATTRTTTKTATTTTKATTTTTTTTQLIMTTTAMPYTSNMYLIADSVYAYAGQKQVPVNIWVRNNAGFAPSGVQVIHSPGIVPSLHTNGNPMFTKGTAATELTMTCAYNSSKYLVGFSTIGLDNANLDGTYATLYFDVPNDAAPGSVYYVALNVIDMKDYQSNPIFCESYGGAIVIY